LHLNSFFISFYRETIEEIWRKGSQSMRMIQQIKIGIFEQIKLDRADFFFNKLSSQNTFANIINSRLQNVIKGYSPLQFWNYKSTFLIGI